MEQGTSEWLDWRRRRICASDSPIICGFSPYDKTPYKLWEEKLGINKPENRNSFILEMGKKFEERARADFELKMAMEFPPILAVHASEPWLGASLDGYNSDNNAILEIKMVGQEKMELIKNSMLPPADHYCQLMHQMLVCGGDKVFYLAYTVDKDYKDITETCTFQVKQSPSFIQNMVPKLRDFWTCVEKQTPPPLTDKDVKIIKEKNAIKLADIYCEKKKEFEHLEKELNDLKETLISISGEHPRTQVSNVTINKYLRRGNIEYKKIEALKDIDLERYRGKSSLVTRIDIENK